MTSIRFPSRTLVVATSIALLSHCSPSDSEVPWDTAPMARELMSQLQRFEGLTSEFERHEVLGWQVNDRQDGRARQDIVLVWGRMTSNGPKARWVLIQGFRSGSEDTWRRGLVFTYLRAPLAHPRPGEDRSGTWHGFHAYDHAPTSLEICDFAKVRFFNTEEIGAGYRRVSGAVQKRAWLRVTGEEPRCGFAD